MRRAELAEFNDHILGNITVIAEYRAPDAQATLAAEPSRYDTEFQRLGVRSFLHGGGRPEFPGNGDWGWPLHQFNRDGSRSQQFGTRWGTPFVIRVEAAPGSWWARLPAVTSAARAARSRVRRGISCACWR